MKNCNCSLILTAVTFCVHLLCPMRVPGAAPQNGLHVQGRFLVDGNGEQVVFRGVEHVIRWGAYSGDVPWGDVPWEGWANDSAGAQLAQIAKTGANAVRILGGKPEELERILYSAIVVHKMFVSIARVNWRDQRVINAIGKFANYVTLHAQGEVPHRNEVTWREAAKNVVAKMRELGYTSPIEVLSTGYGQTLSTILNHGKEVFDSDPLKNVVFGVQLYSEHAGDIPGTFSKIESFAYPIWAGSCYFGLGIKNGWGNNADTYNQVWDGSYARSISSLYWNWSGDGEGNAMTSSGGSYDNLTAIGRYIVKESPAALEKTVKKTKFLLDAREGGGGNPDGPFTLTITVNGPGKVQKSPDAAEYSRGTKVTLTAVPDSKMRFDKWSGSVSSTANPMTVTVNSSMTIAAFFSDPSAPVGLVRNGDFSNGTSGWSLGQGSGYGGSSASFAVQDGQAVVSIGNGGTEQWHVQLTQTDIVIESGSRYRLGFSAKASSGRSIDIGLSDPSDYSRFGGMSASLSSEMQKFETVFTASKSGTARIEVNLGGAVGSSGTVTLDDIYFVKITNDDSAVPSTHSRSHAVFKGTRRVVVAGAVIVGDRTGKWYSLGGHRLKAGSISNTRSLR